MILFCYSFSMKRTSKKSSLLLCWLGAVALLTVFTGSVNAIKIGNDTVKIPDNIQQHISRLYSLYVSESAGLEVKNDRLNITQWFIIGNGSSNSSDTTILWGTNNEIWSSSSNSWIAWWQENIINSAKSSVIWWWIRNTISADMWVIAWGEGNTITKWSVSTDSAPSVIVWWYNNKANDWWIILGGAENIANWANSLALWEKAEAGQWSFAWNWKAKPYSAHIWASNWVLIGTMETKKGINLVVNWTMSIWWDTTSPAVAWEMRSINGCFYAYDGQNWHIVGQYRNECDGVLDVSDNCKFGNVLLQMWDKVEAYPQRASTNCIPQTVVCGENWTLKGEGSDNTDRYPYCYKTAN